MDFYGVENTPDLASVLDPPGDETNQRWWSGEVGFCEDAHGVSLAIDGDWEWWN